MRSSNPPNLVEWAAASSRGVILTGMALAAESWRAHYWLLALILAAACLWNVYLLWLASQNQRMKLINWHYVAIDSAIACLAFSLSGGFAGNLAWSGLLPLSSAALLLSTRGVVTVTLVNLAVQGVLGLFSNDLASLGISLSLLLPFYLGIGMLAVYLIQRMQAQITQKELAQEQRQHAERERRRSVYKMISFLSASLNYQRVLETALDLSPSVLADSEKTDGYMVSAVLLYSNGHRNGDELHVGSARRFTNADMRKTLAARSGLLHHVIASGESRLTRQPAKDPELSSIVSLHNCQSVYCLPLRSGLDTYGVLLFGHPERTFFNAEKREILDLIGNQAMIAIQNARLYHELEVEKERMMEIQEEARKKLARDLHDGPTQSVSALAMRINIARRLLEKNRNAAAAEELYKIEELARRTTKEIRHMLFTLRPLVLETQGLIATLQSMAEKLHETYNQQVIIEAEPEAVAELEMSRQAVIFYIAEEAVNNARKHAQAAHIWVRLRRLSNDLVGLEIEDDGRGFDLGNVQGNYEQRGSLGMINMRERTELVNGLLHIDSRPGRGTRVQVAIPLTELAADRLRQGA